MSEQINKLIILLDTSVEDFVDGLDVVQRKTFDKVLLLIKDLDVDSFGNVKISVDNIRLISSIKREMDDIVLSEPYLNKVKEFSLAFDTVAKLQDSYFSTIAVKYKPAKVLAELKKVAITSTVELMTEAGISANYTGAISDIIKTKITTGGSYAELTEQLKTTILGSGKEEGGLVKYAKTIATDSINTYSRTYNKMVSDDLGLNWFQFVGSNIKTTRPFCQAMTKKRYFHRSEIPEIIRGNIDGKKVSTAGMKDDTNANNFQDFAGGWNCRHGIFGVPAASVPKELRIKFETVSVDEDL